MLSTQRFMTIVRAGAVYDLAVGLMLITPWGFALLSGLLEFLHHNQGLPGTFPARDVLHVFLANLGGTFLVVWGTVKLRLNQPVLGRYDAAIRLVFSVWMIFALFNGLSPAIAPLLLFEFGFGVLQLWPYTDAETAPS